MNLFPLHLLLPVRLFDLIIVDSTDFNQAVTLFTMEFYSNCKDIMKSNTKTTHPNGSSNNKSDSDSDSSKSGSGSSSGGIMIINVESPSYSLGVVRSSSDKLKNIWKNVFYYQVCCAFLVSFLTACFCSITAPFSSPPPLT